MQSIAWLKFSLKTTAVVFGSIFRFVEMRYLIVLIFLLGLSLTVQGASPRRRVKVNANKNNEEPRNNIILEKVEYRVLNRSVASNDWLEIKPIAPNVYRLNFTTDLLQQSNEGWVRGVLYHKYTTYQKFLIDYKLEGCSLMNALLNDNSTNPFAQYIIENIYEFYFDDGYETNFNFKCPLYPGTYYFVSISFSCIFPTTVIFDSNLLSFSSYSGIEAWTLVEFQHHCCRLDAIESISMHQRVNTTNRLPLARFISAYLISVFGFDLQRSLLIMAIRASFGHFCTRFDNYPNASTALAVVSFSRSKEINHRITDVAAGTKY